jgi:hypothetical protein
MQVRISLDWALEESLRSRQSTLIAALKPGIVAWGQQIYARLLAQLDADPTAEDILVTEAPVHCEGVWLFRAMSVSGEHPPGIVIMIGTTQQRAQKMADAFLASANARFSAATPAASPADIGEAVISDDIAAGRQRLLKVFGGRQGMLAWMLLELATTGQPTDVTYYRRKPTLNVTVDPRLAYTIRDSANGAKALQKAMRRIRLSDGTATPLSEVWTVNPMPIGGLSEDELAAADMSQADIVVGENGATMRQVIHETYHCTSAEEEEFYLRRFIAS